MALANVQRGDWNEFGEETWRLYDRGGAEIAVFTEFCRKLEGAYATRVRYCIVVSRFIDYLYEAGVLGGAPVTRSVINNSIDYYLSLLRQGPAISFSYGKNDDKSYAEGDQAKEVALRQIAKKLGINALASNSWDNTLAPLNRFLRLCALLEREAKEIALIKGGLTGAIVAAAEYDYGPLLEAVEDSTALSSREVQFLKHSTMLGGVIRFRGDRLTRPSGLKKSFKQEAQMDVDSLDFPESYFSQLLESTSCWRDRALWTLLMGTGIRRSEALNLQWCDIEFTTREVFVLDPNFLRYGRDITPAERKKRFKGRTVSQTYFRAPYKGWFFEFLRLYRKEEYRLPIDGNDYVFQYIIRPHLGRPWYEASDQTLNEAFTSAVVRAGIPGPPICKTHVWTAHSLRHAYARFLINDQEVPGQDAPGLTEAEIQLLMGHKQIGSTRKYAKLRPQRLIAKLAKLDQRRVLGYDMSPSLLALPSSN